MFAISSTLAAAAKAAGIGVVTPGVNLDWSITKPEQVKAAAEALIIRSRKAMDNIAAAASNPTWAGVMQPMVDAGTMSQQDASVLEFLQHVSADKELRDASTEADKAISEFSIESDMRMDVYSAVKAFADTAEAKALKGEQARYLERVLRDYNRDGMHLDKATRDKVKAIKEKMSTLSITFSKNCNDVDTKFTFTPEELDGLSESDLSRLTKLDSGKYEVPLDYFPYFPCMDYVKVEETRKVLEKAFNARCMDTNTAILTELCVLRNEKALILGYPDHASFVLDVRMAKTPKAVVPFLSDLSEKLVPLRDAERAVMLELKKAEKEAAGQPFDGEINGWDFRYYDRMVKQEKYKVDQNKLREYFPLDVVTKGLLEIYQELLGLIFTELPDAPTWHPEVQTFEVRNDTKGQELVGYFYLDMFPRDGKYGHAACWGLQPGCTLPGGARQLPVSACVCNFTKPTADEPSLLGHSEVETFFHEFGHCMHGLCCSEVTISRFSGTAVERDFVEAPSQMLENWCWETPALARMSKHFKTGKPIPPELVKLLVASKNANAGHFNKRQLVFGLFDQRIHGKPDPAWGGQGPPLAEEYARIIQEVMGVPATEGTCMPASFGHLAGGYDAQYYGYMWSEVFSADMFDRIMQDPDGGGVFSKAGGRAYRDCILAVGGSVDAADMLKTFLGRDPTQDAFLKSKGL